MCVEGPLLKTLTQIANGKDKDAVYFYVDFILTSANTWKTPIEDFTLIVERPHEKDTIADYVSFCWDGPVTKIDADHFEAHAVNFVPKKEIRIWFFEESKSSLPRSPSKIPDRGAICAAIGLRWRLLRGRRSVTAEHGALSKRGLLRFVLSQISRARPGASIFVCD